VRGGAPTREQALAIAERDAAERDGAMAAATEHKLLLEQFNSKGSQERQALLTELSTVRAAERGARE